MRYSWSPSGVLVAARLAGLAGAVAVICSAAAATAQDAGTVKIGRTSDADRYDPHRSTALAAAEVLYMIGDTLVTLSHDLKTVEPALAKKLGGVGRRADLYLHVE